MKPWDIKRQIEAAFIMAERYGFELREDPVSYGYDYGPIFLFAAPTNTVFAKDIVLQKFDSWAEVTTFFLGYARCDMANAATKVKK